MDFSRISQIASRALGIAIGAGFSIYFTLKALLCLSKDKSQIIAVVCMAVIITVVTLIKSNNKDKAQI